MGKGMKLKGKSQKVLGEVECKARTKMFIITRASQQGERKTDFQNLHRIQFKFSTHTSVPAANIVFHKSVFYCDLITEIIRNTTDTLIQSKVFTTSTCFVLLTRGNKQIKQPIWAPYSTSLWFNDGCISFPHVINNSYSYQEVFTELSLQSSSPVNIWSLYAHSPFARRSQTWRVVSVPCNTSLPISKCSEPPVRPMYLRRTTGVLREITNIS